MKLEGLLNMTAKKKADAALAAQQEVVTSVKGFDKDLKCRGFQFAICETYEVSGEVKACENGFHAIEGHPLEVFGYYAPAGSRFCEVKQFGPLARHDRDSKLASAKITIGVELHIHELIQRAVKWVFDKATPENTEHATGDYGAASSTGNRGAASSTGNRGAASSTGYQGAASSTGNRGAASSTGDYGAASSTGYQGAAMASGYGGKVKGADGNALFLVHRDDDYKITHAWAGIAGQNGIKPGVWYTLNADGQPQECA
jgi:hypothetical protein